MPYLGVLLYLIIYTRGMAERNAAQGKAMEQAFDDRVRQASGTERGGRDRRRPEAEGVRRDHRRGVRAAEGEGAGRLEAGAATRSRAVSRGW